MNGVSATDPVALANEVMSVSQQAGTADVRYIRDGVTASLVITIQ